MAISIAVGRPFREMTEPELYDCVLDGPGVGKALTELLTRHRPAARQVAKTILRNGDDAEDVTQEALLRALVALRSGQRPQNFRGWLKVITARVALNFERQRRTRASYHAESGVVGSCADHFEDRFVAKNTWDRTTSVLRTRDRTLLWLRYAEGLSITEVSTRLGIAVATAKMRLLRARERLIQATPSPLAA